MAFGSEQWMYASGGFYDYPIDQSLRFNRPDAAYLTRTPASASNRKTWTWSGWVKRSDVVSQQAIFNAGRNVVGVQSTGWSFIPSGELRMYTATVGVSNEGFMQSTAVFRDPSAWYHLVLVIDSTQTNQDDRVKAWVNGESIPLVSQGWYVQQNYDTAVNSTLRHDIGHVDAGGVDFGGYMAEVNFIDGQALDPTSFGEFKSGVWVAKEYEGTYGTNGFYLPFNDAGFLGKDNSTILGPDLVTNGSFDTDTSNWLLNGSCTTSWTAGKMQINRTGGTGPTAYQAITCEVGETYAIRTQINSVGSTGDLRVMEGINTGIIFTLSGTNGATVDVSGQFTATQTTHYLQFFVDNSGTSIIVDDVSVKKISSQGNDWAIKNLAVTDQMLDSPTNNFCTINSLTTAPITYSEGNLKYYNGGNYAGSSPTMRTGVNKKYYSEMLIVALGGDSGVAIQDSANGESIGWIYNGNTYGTLAAGFVMPTYTTGDIIGFALDGENNQAQFYKNGVAAGQVWQFNSNFPSIFESHTGYLYGGSDRVANFGQDSSFAGNKTRQGNTDANGIGDFYYAPPAGYLALCTANLPDPVIDPAQDDVPEDYFNTVLYTGNGSTQSITGVGFQPDFLWIKGRSLGYAHLLFDIIRGAGTLLISSSTLGDTGNAGDFVTSFDADGFTVNTTYQGGTNTSSNGSGDSYVGWNWKADGAGVTNTDGSITSTVSANQKAGFSVVSYTGNLSSAGTATVGHGLGVEPDMIITKARSSTSDWIVMHRDLASWSHNLYLNLTAVSTDTSIYGSRSVSTSTFTTNYVTGLNINGVTQIAYCFHSVDGYSKFGSYTGNASADGPFVYTGFRPAFVLVKSTQSTNQWYIYDTKRDLYNPEQSLLIPNSSGAEFAWQHVDFLSNGFKIKSDNWDWNYPGEIIYMAFAEMPFKYANAR